jgi:hypothetical protein
MPATPCDSDAEKAASKAKADAKKQKPLTDKRRPGRPQGSKNTPKAAVTRTPELLRVTGMLDALLKRIAGVVPLTYLVLDGHFGNHNALNYHRVYELEAGTYTFKARMSCQNQIHVFRGWITVYGLPAVRR